MQQCHIVERGGGRIDKAAVPRQLVTLIDFLNFSRDVLAWVLDANMLFLRPGKG